MSDEPSKYISYGFRTKLKIPLEGGDIRLIIEKGAWVFKYLSEGNLEELAIFMKYNPKLNDVLERWVQWIETQKET